MIVYKDGKEVILPPISNRREVDFGPGEAAAVGPAVARNSARVGPHALPPSVRVAPWTLAATDW